MNVEELIRRWRRLAETFEQQADHHRKNGRQTAALVYQDQARTYRDVADQLQSVLTAAAQGAA